MTIREALGSAPPHLSLKAAWKRVIQVSRGLKRAGAPVTIRGRAEVDRFLNQEAPPDWDPAPLKQILKSLLGSHDEAEQLELGLEVDHEVSRLLNATECGDVCLTIAGGPSWLSTAQLDEWLGTERGVLQCTAEKAAAWRHHLHGFPVGGDALSVTADTTLPLPKVRREDRMRKRTRGSNLWVPHWDDIGRVSLSPRRLAEEHAASLRPYAEVIFDPFCGLGGDAIAAATGGAKVFAAEHNGSRLQLAKQNAEALGVDERITFWHGNGPAQLDAWAQDELAHCLFLDPPWGGRGWDRQHMNWDVLCGQHSELVPAMRRAKATLIKLPRTFQTESLRAIGGTWTFTLALGDPSDHPADRVRFLRGLHRP